MKERVIYDAIENTSNTKYMNLFENPTYEAIEDAKVMKIAEEKNNHKKLVKQQKKSRGIISPALLGGLICILSMLGVILAHIAYLVS